jgi:hypothetical protein
MNLGCGLRAEGCGSEDRNARGALPALAYCPCPSICLAPVFSPQPSALGLWSAHERSGK